MLRVLVILPTYMEKDTLPVVLTKILTQELADILVIDDNSPDGTAQIAGDWASRNSRVHLMNRQAKLGLGTAYMAGFLWGLDRGYDCFVEMDSDMSHNPMDLPGFLNEIEKGADLVIGSRYMGGTISVVGWDFKRLLLSKFGNIYASTVLGMKFLSDLTSGYRAFSRRAIESIGLGGIHSEGYAFQIEMAYLAWRAGLKVTEVPIIFTERASGSSKMNRHIVREAVRLPWRLKLKEVLRGKKRKKQKPFSNPPAKGPGKTGRETQ